MVQYWSNDRGDLLCVVDVTKVKGGIYYGKRVRHGRYVVGYNREHYKDKMNLSFDYISGVRWWMRTFGFKFVREE